MIKIITISQICFNVYADLDQPYLEHQKKVNSLYLQFKNGPHHFCSQKFNITKKHQKSTKTVQLQTKQDNLQVILFKQINKQKNNIQISKKICSSIIKISSLKINNNNQKVFTIQYQNQILGQITFKYQLQQGQQTIKQTIISQSQLQIEQVKQTQQNQQQIISQNLTHSEINSQISFIFECNEICFEIQKNFMQFGIEILALALVKQNKSKFQTQFVKITQNPDGKFEIKWKTMLFLKFHENEKVFQMKIIANKNESQICIVKTKINVNLLKKQEIPKFTIQQKDSNISYGQIQMKKSKKHGEQKEEEEKQDKKEIQMTEMFHEKQKQQNEKENNKVQVYESRQIPQQKEQLKNEEIIKQQEDDIQLVEKQGQTLKLKQQQTNIVEEKKETKGEKVTKDQKANEIEDKNMQNNVSFQNVVQEQQQKIIEVKSIFEEEKPKQTSGNSQLCREQPISIFQKQESFEKQKEVKYEKQRNIKEIQKIVRKQQGIVIEEESPIEEKNQIQKLSNVLEHSKNIEQKPKIDFGQKQKIIEKVKQKSPEKEIQLAIEKEKLKNSDQKTVIEEEKQKSIQKQPKIVKGKNQIESQKTKEKETKKFIHQEQPKPIQQQTTIEESKSNFKEKRMNLQKKLIITEKQKEFGKEKQNSIEEKETIEESLLENQMEIEQEQSKTVDFQNLKKNEECQKGRKEKKKSGSQKKQIKKLINFKIQKTIGAKLFEKEKPKTAEGQKQSQNQWIIDLATTNFLEKKEQRIIGNELKKSYSVTTLNPNIQSNKIQKKEQTDKPIQKLLPPLKQNFKFEKFVKHSSSSTINITKLDETKIIKKKQEINRNLQNARPQMIRNKLRGCQPTNIKTRNHINNFYNIRQEVHLQRITPPAPQNFYAIVTRK